MGFHENLAPSANPPPFSDEASLPKQVALNAHPVEPPHVAGEINPTQVKRGREYLKLNTKIEHIVILLDKNTISGR